MAIARKVPQNAKYTLPDVPNAIINMHKTVFKSPCTYLSQLKPDITTAKLEQVNFQTNNKNVSQMFLYQNHIGFTIVIAIFSEILPNFHEKISKIGHFWVGKFLKFDFKLTKSSPRKSI